MTFIKKNKALCVAIIIELILLLFTAWDFFLPRFYHNMDASGIPFNGGSVEDGGCFVNEENGNAGYFTYGPNIELPRGVFSITVNYKTDTSGNTVACMGSNTTLRSLKYDSITLNPEKNSVTFTLWSSKKTDNFQTATIYSGNGSLTIYSIEIAETYAGSTLMAFNVILWGTLINLIIIGYYYWKKHDISNETIRNIMVLAGLIIFSTYPIFTDYLTEGHDLLFHLLRIEGIKDGLLSGQFPVKIQPTQLNGYGYAASVFYGDLFLYIPAIFRIIGFSIQDSYKFFVFIVNTAAVLLSFYSFNGILKNKNAALFATILYSMSPYRLINIYGRAAVGEYTAMIFLPLLALGLYRIFTDDIEKDGYSRNWIIPVIAYTGIIESHILSCEMVGIFTIIICLVFVKKVFIKKRFLVLLKTVIFTILLNLGFIVPLADYMIRKICIISEGAMTTSNIQQNGLYPARLFTIFLNGDSMPYSRKANYELGMQGEMGISAGIALIMCFLLFLYFMVIKSKKKNTSYKLGIFAWWVSAITLIMSLDIFPWDFMNDLFGDLAGMIQFPWRLIGIGSVAMSIVGACAFIFISDNYRENLTICFISITISIAVLTSGWMLGDLLDNEIPYRVYSVNALRTETSGTYFNEYAPIDTNADHLTGNCITSSDAVTISGYNKKYINITAYITNTSGSDGYVELPLLYYPYYKAIGSNGDLECISGSSNTIRLKIPAEYTGNIHVTFRQPLLWRFSEIVSIITVIYIFMVTLKNKRRI